MNVYVYSPVGCGIPDRAQNMVPMMNKSKEKVYFSSPNFHESPLFLPQLQNRANHLPQLFKPCILPPWSGFEGGFATVNVGFCYSEAVLSFSFLFISAESLKNHIKSQKNHKMENPILLHST
jgi:hypothetical protein